MRVLLVNTSERSGGAAVAAHRLMEALNNNGVKARMLVRDKQTDDINVSAVGGRLWGQWLFLWERWCIFCHLHFNRRHLFEVDTASMGFDITHTREFREADVIHLHWVNQGMLSLAVIRKILRSGKPVVWTMHDAWPATAICHLTLGCQQFKSNCKRCKYLPNGGSDSDLSARVWRRKQRMLAAGNVHFVACSRWLQGEAKVSALLREQRVDAIPNPIDTRVFHPQDKAAARQQNNLPVNKRIILFASQRATNPNKGMSYLVEACRLLVKSQPSMANDTCVAILGGHAEEVEGLLPFETIAVGYVSDERRLVSLYSAADVFVLPSLSENLPNTIMEAMACGVPCVGFRVGGIAEMIDHRQNGYVAEYRNAADLAEGLRWTLTEADPAELKSNALKKVYTCYSQQSVAMKYIEIYNQAVSGDTVNGDTVNGGTDTAGNRTTDNHTTDDRNTEHKL